MGNPSKKTKKDCFLFLPLLVRSRRRVMLRMGVEDNQEKEPMCVCVFCFKKMRKWGGLGKRQGWWVVEMV